MKSTLDVSFANVNLADAKLLLVQAQNDLKAAEADLATAMGLPNEAGFVLDEEPMPAPMPDRVDDLIREAMQNRPELKDLRLQQSAAERFTKAEHALYYPSVGVVGTAGFVPTGVRDDSEPLRRDRHERLDPDLQRRPVQGPADGSRAEGQGRHRERERPAEPVIRDVRVAWLNATTAYDRMALTKQLLAAGEYCARPGADPL